MESQSAPAPLLLITNRLAIKSLLESPPEREAPAFDVIHLPLEPTAIEGARAEMERAAVAVVDFIPSPALAIRACRLLRDRAPSTPTLVLACCPDELTAADVDAL